MAVTAKFQADFSDFLRAVKAADGSLEALQSAAGSTTSSVQRLANSFSGETLIRRATDAVESIKLIGGVSKLSDSEVSKLSAEMERAIDKMQRMGVAVPTTVGALRSELIDRLPAAAEKSTGAMAKLGQGFTQAFAAFTVAGLAERAISQLISVGSTALQAAGDIADLADKTGLSVSTLQEMSFVAGQTGTTIEALSKAALDLGIRLGKGGKGVAEAVSELGLELKTLQGLSPDEQFREIARAVGEIESPQDRARIAVELFGKSGKEILAAIEQGYDRLAAAAPIMSDKNVESLDRIGDHWALLKDGSVTAIGAMIAATFRFGETISNVLTLGQYATAVEGIANSAVNAAGKIEKVTQVTDDYVGVYLEALEVTSKLTKEQVSQIASGERMGATMEELTGHFGVSEQVIKLATERYKALTDAQKKSEEQTAKAAATQKKFLDSIGDLRVWAEYKQGVQDSGEALQNLSKGLEANGNLMSRSNKEAGIAQVEAQKLADEFTGKLVPAIKAVSTALEKPPDLAAFKGAISQLGPTILGALQGGGDVVKSIAGSLGQGLGTDLVTKFGGSILSKLGPTLGGAVNALIPGVGALLGPLMSAVAGKLKGLFTDTLKKEVEASNKEIDKLKDALFKSFGPLDDLERKAQAVGLSFVEAFGHQGQQGLKDFTKLTEEFKKRWEALNLELKDSQEALKGVESEIGDLIGKAKALGYELDQQGNVVGISFEKMKTLAKDYGIDLAALGPAFKAAEISKGAAQLIMDFDLLTRGGADVGAVLLGMSGAINKLVQDSIAFGVTIPENMRPLIQGLLEAGKLTDAQGNKLTDLKGITFGAAVKTEFDKIVDVLTPLIARMGELVSSIQSLSDRIDAATRPRTVDIGFNVAPIPNIPDFGVETPAFGGGVARGRVERFAGGGMVGGSGESDAVPALLTPGEGILSRRGMQALAKLNHGGAIGSDPALRAEIRGLRADLSLLQQAQQVLLPRAIGRAVRDAMQLSGAMA